MTMAYPADDNNLTNIHKALQYDMDHKQAMRTIIKNAADDPLPVSLVNGNISIGNVVASPNVWVDGGTVAISNIPEVEIKNDSGNPVPVSANTSSNSNINPLYVKGVSDSSFFDPIQSDAFGRLRVSNPFTLFDSFHRYQDNGKVNEYRSGTASSAHDSNSSTILLSIGANTGDLVYRESSRVFNYQPGKSLLTLQTFCMSPARAGLRQRIGYFDTSNGIYLERDGITVSLVLRSTSTGVLTERRVNQPDWNQNTLADLDLDRVQIFWMDIEWLGVGSVRCGFVIDGVFVHVHTFHNANTEVSPGVPRTTSYMGTACLPVRVEFENTANTGIPSQFRIICTSVISEGGIEPSGRPLSAGHLLASPRVISSGNGYVPLFTMRLKNSRLGGIVLPKKFSFAVSGNNNYEWRIVIGGTTTGGSGSWTDAGSSNSSVEYALDRTTITGGTMVEQGYIINSNQSSLSPNQAELFKYQLERNTFTGTSTELSLCLACTGTNNNVWASVEWQETT